MTVVEYSARPAEAGNWLSRAIYYYVIFLLLSVAICGVLWTLVVFWVPSFKDIFRDFNTTLPTPTLYLLSFSEWLREPLGMMVAVFLILVIPVLPSVVVAWPRERWKRVERDLRYIDVHGGRDDRLSLHAIYSSIAAGEAGSSCFGRWLLNRGEGRALRVAVTGATGLIGKHLLGKLRGEGHEGIALKRGDGGVGTWNVATGEIGAGGRVDTLVHLAGRNIAARWTRRVRREIWESRVTATEKLCGFLATLPAGERPGVLIAGSAIGIYGSRGDEVLTEESAVEREGRSFLADVCRGWEAATRAAEEAGVRVVHVRLGVVLAKEGGALAKLVTPTKLCLGGPVGRGTQWMSWISLTDVVRLIVRLAADAGATGAVNAVSPQAVRQHEFMWTLGKVLCRPTVFPMPGVVVKLVFGRMGAEVLLGSQRVSATRLPAGFAFEHATLEGALRAELGK